MIRWCLFSKLTLFRYTVLRARVGLVMAQIVSPGESMKHVLLKALKVSIIYQSFIINMPCNIQILLNLKVIGKNQLKF